MNVTLEQTGNISIFKSADGCTVTVIAPEGSRDSFESIGNGFWKWVRKCDTPVDRMTMQIRVSKTPEYFLVPAINYNGNGWGSGAQYSGFECDGVPWQYAWHRASIPACTYAENDQLATALFGEETGGMSCSIYTENGETVQELIWPETEVPKTLSKRCWYPPYYGTMAPQSEFSGIIKFYRNFGFLFRIEVDDRFFRFSYFHFFKDSDFIRVIPFVNVLENSFLRLFGLFARNNFRF